MIININNIVKIFLVSFFIIFCSASPSKALNQVTHKEINKYIANKNTNLNGFSLHQYIQNNLGMMKGSEEFVHNKMVFEWIGNGGESEDAGTRSLNHFLNPITDKGLSGQYSALTWATMPLFSQPLSPFGSWHDARYYFHKALWSNNKTDSDAYFAETFRALGQLMHLVQDMSVPAHTRGDKHPSFWFMGGDDYELWFLKTNMSLLSSYSVKYFTNSASSYFLIPQLFDTGFYDGSNPGITTSSNNIGLAEFTNANFLSADTIFKDFTYPDWNNLQEYEEYIAPGKTAVYQRKTVNGISVEHFVRERIYYDKLPSSDAFRGLRLDDNVHKDYAQLLIPRAIGYSSQALNYFFRGEIEAKLLPVFDESKLTSLRIKIRNINPSKDSMGGADSYFLLAYRVPDSVAGETWSKVPSAYDLEGINIPYGKNDQGENLENAELEISFGDFPADIPISNYQNANFMLIYRGNLGDEKANLASGEIGGVIGKFGAAKPITFHEENNTTPKGDYNWFQMDSPVFGSNVWEGAARNEIIDGKLIKTNARYPIDNPSGPYPGAHFNLSLIGVHNLSGTTYANNIFPIPITKNTYIEFKIDEMTISPHTTEGGSYTHYQGLVLSFNNGYKLELSLDDQFWYINNTTGYFSFNAGQTIVDNIYDMFQQWNLPMPADFKLDSIGLYQQIGFDLPTATQYEQNMIVDFIRIVEMEDLEPNQ